MKTASRLSAALDLSTAAVLPAQAQETMLRAVFDKAVAWFDMETVKWAAERNASVAKRQAEAGIQVVKVGPELVKLAHETYWAELARRAPEPVKALRPMLDK